MIGVAGAVAELCWRGDFVDEDYWIEPEMMSKSDWGLTQCRPGAPDEKCCEAIRTVAAVLERGASVWGDLVRICRDLIVGAQPILREIKWQPTLYPSMQKGRTSETLISFRSG